MRSSDVKLLKQSRANRAFEAVAESEAELEPELADKKVKPSDFEEYVSNWTADNFGAYKDASNNKVSLNSIDYKNTSLLQSYLSELGHVMPRSKTSLSVKQHRKLVKEVKKARRLALLPFSLY
ncbi:MAG: 30S ribosomal protein S18 [Candidatus Hodgkinia cicadicola]